MRDKMTKLSPKDIEDHIRWLETCDYREEIIVEMTDRFIDTFEPKPKYRFGRDEHGINRIWEEGLNG
jgi:hypothetical protein